MTDLPVSIDSIFANLDLYPDLVSLVIKLKEVNGISSQQLADRIGYSVQGVNQILSRRHSAGREFSQRIIDKNALGFSLKSNGEKNENYCNAFLQKGGLYKYPENIIQDTNAVLRNEKKYPDFTTFINALGEAIGGINASEISRRTGITLVLVWEYMEGKSSPTYPMVETFVKKNPFGLPVDDEGEMAQPWRELFYTKAGFFERTPEAIASRINLTLSLATEKKYSNFGEFFNQLANANGEDGHENLARLLEVRASTIRKIRTNQNQPSPELLEKVIATNCFHLPVGEDGKVTPEVVKLVFDMAGLVRREQDEIEGYAKAAVKKIRESGEAPTQQDVLKVVFSGVSRVELAQLINTNYPGFESVVGPKFTEKRVSDIVHGRVKIGPVELGMIGESLGLSEEDVNYIRDLPDVELKPGPFGVVLKELMEKHGQEGITQIGLSRKIKAITGKKVTNTAISYYLSRDQKPLRDSLRSIVTALETGNSAEDIERLVTAYGISKKMLFANSSEIIGMITPETQIGELLGDIRIAPDLDFIQDTIPKSVYAKWESAYLTVPEPSAVRELLEGPMSDVREANKRGRFTPEEVDAVVEVATRCRAVWDGMPYTDKIKNYGGKMKSRARPMDRA